MSGTIARAACLVLLVLAMVSTVAGTATAAGGDEPCQDPRLLGAGCPVCWEVYEPYQIGKLHCTRTEMPS